MAKIIAISNHKGGVGKSCSTANIGAALTKAGKKVVLIDLDPQANLTLSFGLKDISKSIYNALSGQHKIKDLLITIEKNLFIVPSHLDLSGAEIELSSESGRELILKELLAPIRSNYDYILIDCPPSLGLLTLNAFTAADEVLIPLQAQFLAMQGVAKLTEIINKIKKRLNPKLNIGGVFLTQYDKRKILNRDVSNTVEEFFKEKIFKTRIRDNVALAEAPSQGIDIFRYNSKSSGAEDYFKLTKEILGRFGDKV